MMLIFLFRRFSMVESDIYHMVKKYVELRKGRYTRIENAATAGVPDINVRVDGSEYWIECKYAQGRSVKLRPSQVNWGMSQVRAGGNWFCIVGHKDGLALAVNADILRMMKNIKISSLKSFDSIDSVFNYMESLG